MCNTLLKKKILASIITTVASINNGKGGVLSLVSSR